VRSFFYPYFVLLTFFFLFFPGPVIIIQRVTYGNAPPISALLAEEEELEQALALAED